MIETLDESAAFACLMYCLCIRDMHWHSLVSIMDNIVEILEILQPFYAFFKDIFSPYRGHLIVLDYQGY